MRLRGSGHVERAGDQRIIPASGRSAHAARLADGNAHRLGGRRRRSPARCAPRAAESRTAAPRRPAPLRSRSHRPPARSAPAARSTPARRGGTVIFREPRFQSSREIESAIGDMTNRMKQIATGVGIESLEKRNGGPKFGAARVSAILLRLRRRELLSGLVDLATRGGRCADRARRAATRAPPCSRRRRAAPARPAARRRPVALSS